MRRPRLNALVNNPAATPIQFEAALPLGTAFTLSGEGDATLKLSVPEQFAKILSDSIHRLRNRSFVVIIEGAENQ